MSEDALVGSPSGEAPGRLSHRQVMTVLSGLMLGMLLAALDQTVVATAMKTIADQLNGQTLQAWATTAYLITVTLSTPLYGKLSDIYGRKPLYLTAISIFLLGSVGSTVAGSMYELSVARAVQGLGAGGLMSLAIAILVDMVPAKEGSKYSGYLMSVYALASVAGPVAGGLFAGLPTLLGIAGWRWVFLINVPIAAVALVVVARVLNLPHRRLDQRVDYWGAAALVVGLVPLLTVAQNGRDWGWGAPLSVVMYCVSVVGLIAFVLVEIAMKDDALLPMRLFRRPVFSVGNSTNFIVGLGMFGGMLTLPLYLQIVKGFSPTASGLSLLPMMVGMMVATAVGGAFSARIGKYKIFSVIGVALMAISLLGASQLGVDTATWLVVLIILLLGAGVGLNIQMLITAITNDVPAGDIGVATALATFFRQIGGTIGAAVFLSVLFDIVGGRIIAAFSQARGSAAFQAAINDPAVRANPANQIVLRGGQAGSSVNLNDTAFLHSLDPRLARPFLDGFAGAMDLVFLIGAGVLVVGFVLVLFLPQKPLRDESGLQRRAQADAERDSAV